MAGEKPEDRPRTKLNIGASVLPELPQDSTDRNRTSPFAFTGNKFEFRMPGSSCSIACPNMILNTIVAEAFTQFADVLEKSDNFHKDLDKLIHDTLVSHYRIVYGGNNYSDEWRQEAQRRGLSNFTNTVEVLPHYTDEKNVALFEKHKVLSGAEIASRQEVLLENYVKNIGVEAATFIDLVKKDILPAVFSYEKELMERISLKRNLSLDDSLQMELLTKYSDLAKALYEKVTRLEVAVEEGKAILSTLDSAVFARENLFHKMESLRETVDALEILTPRAIWPFPTYSEILYSVK